MCTAAEPALEGAGDVASTVAGEVAGDAAGVVGGELPGDPAGAVAGELAGEDAELPFAEASAAEVETAVPWAGLAAPAGDGDSSDAGARAPMSARSWPIRIFPRNTGRSKM